jgi:Pyridoxamine 5'-phosphate oxidase
VADMTPVAAEPLLADGATPTSWAQACRHLERGDTYWLGTVRPDGRPQVRPVLAVWLDGALHFCTSTTTRKGRNLAHDPHCVLAVGNDAADLVVEGEAVRVGDEARLRRVAEVFATKYDWHVAVRDGAFYADGAPTAGPPPYHVHEVTPTTAFAFGKDESFSPTRWRFEAASP